MSRPPRLLLDAGALISAERDPRGKVVAECRVAVREQYRPLLPSVVFAQVWRGHPRQHALSTVRRLCREVAFSPETADAVGRLLGRSGTSDVVDAAVVVTAIEHDAVVLTSDPDDLAHLADAAGFSVRLLAV